MERYINISSKEAASETAAAVVTVTIDGDDDLKENPTNAISNPWPFIEKYFKFVDCRGPDNFEFQCLLCRPTFKTLSVNRRSLYNLKKHIKSIHPGIFETFLNCITSGFKANQLKGKICNSFNDNTGSLKITHETQPTLSESFKNMSKFSQHNYENKVLNFFVGNMLPLAIVETSSFQELIQCCTSAAKPMSRRTLTRRIENRFSEAKEQLKQDLRTISSLCTTADAWSCRNRSYLGMTVHWIDEENLQRRKAVLACRRLIGRHTYDALAKEISDIHWDFGIEGKVVMTTTDNGSNFLKAFNEFGEKEATVDDVEDEEIVEVHELSSIFNEKPTESEYSLPKHMKCSAHTLNLVATVDASKAVDQCPLYKKVSRSAFGKAQQLWNKQSRSTQAADIIKAECGVMLITPVITRWNSIFDSVNRLLVLMQDREKLANLNRACHLLSIPAFTQVDVNFFRAYAKAMKPLCQALDLLQGEKNAYTGILLPTITNCIRKMDLFINEEGRQSICFPIAMSVKNGLLKRFENSLNCLDFMLASTLHPTFKLKWLHLLAFVLEEDENSLESRIKNKLISLLQAHEKNFENNIGAPEENIVDLATTSNSNEDFFGNIFTHREVSQKNEREILDSFLNCHGSVGGGTRVSCSSFNDPRLLELFIEYNTAVPSSAAVERLFSLGKDVLKPKRSGLSDEHFEMLVFLKEKCA